MSVRVKLLDAEDCYLGRTMSLNVNNKSVEGFQISRRSNRSKFEHRMFEGSDRSAICEYSIGIDCRKLDKLASDNDAFRNFVHDRMPRIKTSDEINMVVFQIDETVGYLNETEIETLGDLLLTRGNDIIVPPFVRTMKGGFDADRYIQMISVLRDYLGPGCNMACSIPDQASKKDIPRIMGAMDTSSQIFVKDFNGKKVLDPVSEMQLRTILKNIRKIEKENSEGSFFYGFDSRPSPKNGTNRDFAEGQITSAVGLSAVGPKRKAERLPPQVIEKIGGMNPYDSQRLFDATDYRFHTISSGHVTDRYADFIGDIWGCDYHELKIEDLRNSVFAFNLRERTADVRNIDEAIEDNELKGLIEEKKTPDSTVKYLEKVSKNVNSRSE